jgi:hypothetical protein
MLLRLIGSTLKLSILFLLMLTPKLALADVIYGRDNKFFGTINAISDTAVSITQGCDSSNSTAVNWDEIRSIALTGTCTDIKDVRPIQFGAGSDKDCKEELLTLFLIKFKDEGSGILADSVSMGSDKNIRVIKRGSPQTVSGPANSVSGIKRIKACSERSAIQNMIKNGTMPSTFNPQL